MRVPTVLYDACVLYPAPLRDLLIQLALDELFRAKWSNSIHDEWIRNVLKVRPDLSSQQLDRTRALMNFHVLDALVEGFEKIEKTLDLPDPNDNHVLAAAIVSSSDMILTFNLKDFPDKILSTYHIKAMHPDDFLMCLLDKGQGSVFQSLKSTRLRLRKPPKSVDEYLEILDKQGLRNTVKLLNNFKRSL